MVRQIMNKNNVIIFSNHLLPYSETFILNQGEALTRYQAQYLGSNLVPLGLETPVERTYLINRGKLGTLSDRLLKLGIVLPNTTSEIRTTNPKLCHAHFGPNGMTASAVTKNLNIPLVITFHGYDLIDSPTLTEHGRLHMRYHHNRTRLASLGTRFLAVSNHIRLKLIKAGFPEDKITQHYIGIDTDRFSPDSSVKREKLVVCVGRLVKYKGQKHLIRAMAKVQTSHDDYRLVLIGEGETEQRLKQLASDLKVNVTFAGRQTPEQVINWLRKARVYVQPSIKADSGQDEALALTIVEAQSVGTPAAVFNTGGMKEAIVDGQSGFVVQNESIVDLAEAISTLIRDNSLWSYFSCEARRFALEVHNLKKQTLKLESIYDQAIQDYTAQSQAQGYFQ